MRKKHAGVLMEYRGWKLRTWLFDSLSQVLLIWWADILVTFSPLSEAAGLVRLYTLGLFSVP